MPQTKPMPVKPLALWVFMLWVFILWASPTIHAQSPLNSAPTVQALGQHVIQLKPLKIRLFCLAKAEGADAKEAIAALAKHKQMVRDELETLKADVKSIQMAPAEVQSHILGLPKQYWSMSAKSLERFLSDSSVSFNLDEMPKVFSATSIVEADWVLPAADADTLAQLPDSIRRQAVERDFIGEQNRMPLSPEQEARVEKFKSVLEENMGYYDPDEDQPSLQVVFVSKLSARDRSVGLGAAFAQAKEECEALAEASGSKLARMVSLAKVDSGDSSDWIPASGGTDDSDIFYSRLSRANRQGEVIASRADQLTMTLQVRLTYSLAP